jgi:hypothetical protein
MTPHTRDLCKLIAKQAIGIGLAFPTAGMSIVMNFDSLDDYTNKYHPDFNYFIS